MTLRRVIALVLGLLVIVSVVLALLGNPTISTVAVEQVGTVHSFGTSI